MATALHQRQVIRHAVRSLLLGHTAAKDRVHASRDVPLRRNEVPAVLVYTVEEPVESDSDTTAPRELTRRLRLEIAGVVGPDPADKIRVDDALDALALEIETVMHADPFLGGACGDSILENTTISLRPDGEINMGIVALSYRVTYRTMAPDTTESDAARDEFLVGDSKYKPPGTLDDANVPEDHFDVRAP